jgi:hypothetical protein
MIKRGAKVVQGITEHDRELDGRSDDVGGYRVRVGRWVRDDVEGCWTASHVRQCHVVQSGEMFACAGELGHNSGRALEQSRRRIFRFFLGRPV